MPAQWIAAKDIPRGGYTVLLDDPAIWSEPIAEFGLPVRAAEPLRASVRVQVQENGFLVRGTLTGVMLAPCCRCAENSRVALAHDFDSFEPFPGSFADPDEAAEPLGAAPGEEVDETVVRVGAHGPELNLPALLWQEMLVALPTKVLCDPACKGLCPLCGANLNQNTCDCDTDEGDPRLAALRGLRVEQ